MSFVAFASPSFASERLKISLVYLHPQGRFSLWLAAGNRGIQADISTRLRGKPLGKYALTKLCPGVDAIIECDISQPYDFDNPDALVHALVCAAEAFQSDMTSLLAQR